jgi:predicted transglutaminase-like cysteine proteinase
MFGIRYSQAIRQVFGLLLAASLSLAAIDDAPAKSRAAKASLEDAPVMAMPAPVRFFTIKDVLAKHDGKRSASAPILASAVDGTIASDIPHPSPSLPQTSDEPFGLYVFRAPDGVLWTKWKAVRNSMQSENQQLDHCRQFADDCSAAAGRFLRIVRSSEGLSDRERIARVNVAVNDAVRYVSDFAQHGVADHWNSPLATLAAGQGDCEDYAILKYAALRQTGVAEADLRLLLVRDRAVGQDHAVLAVRLAAHWLVLDNRRATLFETADLHHFLPLFALDDRGVNLFAAPYAGRILHESETDLLPASNVAASGGGLSELPLLL